MGLFDKKICALCGAKAGLLTRQKLRDKAYLCGDCRAKCSPQLSARVFEQMTPDDAVRHMDYVVENQEMYRANFHETYSINTGIMGGTRVISVDETNGWWIVSSSAMPDLLTFDQILSYRLELTTRRLDDKERHDPHRARMPFPPPGLPGCGPFEEITGMKVIVRLNHIWLDEVQLNVLPAIFVTEGDIHAAYNCTQELFAYFDQQRAAAAYAQPVYAAPAAPVMPVAPAVPTAPASATSQADAIDTLKKFKELLDMGAITQEEFDAKKKQLLGL